MEKRKEELFLNRLLKKIENPNSILALPQFSYVSWLFEILAIVIILRVNAAGFLHEFVFILLLLLVGGISGIVYFLHVAEQNWKVISRHISKTSIENRLTKLKKNSEDAEKETITPE
ncbi:MAG: hypothetical protein KJ630_04040 [Proteobacteria bacterium]|nr:hypothetical protein [Pseudomonadota bacterium]